MTEKNKFIFIDTNIWIYLADDPTYIEQLKKLKEILEFPDFSLVLPDSVKFEYDRHRDSVVKKWQQSLKDQASNSYKVFRMLLPDREAEIKKILQDAQHCIEKGFEQIQTNLSLIGELFSLAEVAPTSHLMVEAAYRCLHHLPPASKSTRSSIGDCLLWLAALDYLKRGEVWFCTNNKGDFSEQKREDILNPDLQNEAAYQKKSMTYFTGPNKMIEAALPYKPKLPEYIDFTTDLQSLGLPFELARTLPSELARTLTSELVRTMRSLSNLKKQEGESLALKPETIQAIAKELRKVLKPTAKEDKSSQDNTDSTSS